MPRSIINIEFLNSNALRAYPLSETASRVDLTGTFTIPDDFILWLRLPINAGLNVQPGKFFIRTIAVFGAGVLITVAYDDGTEDPPTVATATIPKSTHTEYAQYRMPGVGDYEDAEGRIVIGSPRALKALPPGEYTFSPENGKLEADAILPMIQYVSGLVLVNGADRSDVLRGLVELQAGDNIRLTVTDADTGTPRIRIDAISGENLSETCVCDENEGPPIRTIDGIGPDPVTGNFQLEGGNCVTFSPLPNGLKLTNECSPPCCDCPELASLTQELELLGSEARTVQGQVGRVETVVQNLANVILGSTLNDQGCFTCEAG